MAAEVFHVVFLVAVGVLMFAEYRWIARKSAVLGAIVGLGLAIRLASGLAFFLISHHDLSFLSQLHSGDGFWNLAPDARYYYIYASSSAVGNEVYWGVIAAPYYVRALAWWLSATGTSVLSAVLFNTICYMATVAIVVSVRRKLDRQFVSAWLPLILAALSFSPLLIMTSTQVLKDALFVLLVVIACRAAFEILDYFRQRSSSTHSLALFTPIAVGAVAVALLGGVREYYGIFLWLALAAGLVAIICSYAPSMRRVPLALVSITVLAAWWIGFMIGVGAEYQRYGSLIAKTTGLNIPIIASAPDRPGTESLGETVQTRREGFVQTGGATNMVAPTSFKAPKAPETSKAPETPTTGVMEVFRGLATGLLATFVPMSLLKAASLVTFEGGRGLLLVADADTLFIDATLILLVGLMIRHRATVQASLPGVLFAVVLVSVSTILLAYIVTNFGTLFRLRTVMSVPAWLTPLAFAASAANRAVAQEKLLPR
jgi:hypothetical protein